jgi:hypothetical protein
MTFVLPLLLFCACSDRALYERTKVLGEREFTHSAWMNSDQVGRGAMLSSFLKKHKPEELTRKEIEALLGPPTAYYDYDEFPAYLVGPTSIESSYGKGYVIAFITDRKTGYVSRVEMVPEIR